MLAAEDVSHAVGFELEHAFRVSAAEHVEGFLIVLIDSVYIEIGNGLPYELDGVLDERECLESEEVHLHEAAVLDLRHRVLRRYGSCLRVSIERYILVEVLPPDDDACGMER